MSLGPRDRGTESHELVLRQRLLDQREQHVFLMADVPTQTCAQLVQIGEGGNIRVGQRLCPPPQVDVLYEDAHDRVMVGRHVAGERGEQHLLLDGELWRPSSSQKRKRRRAAAASAGAARLSFRAATSPWWWSRESGASSSLRFMHGVYRSEPLRGSLDQSGIDGS